MLKKKIREIVVGTNNQGKYLEIRELLPKNTNVISLKNFKVKSPKENGKSFQKNSLIKARYFSKKTGKICLADDSGLEIDVLDKAPGIYSARWAGRKNNFNVGINKIFKKLNKKDVNWKKKKIKARFICCLTIYWTNGKFFSSTGKIEGEISKSKKGNNGKGYAPIFIPSKNLLDKIYSLT